MALTKRGRWGVGALIFICLGALYGGIFFIGFFLGIMGTDSCHGVEDYAITYLVLVWPLTLFIAALTPALLFIFNRKAITIVVTGILVGLFSLLAYIPYLPLLNMACHR